MKKVMLAASLAVMLGGAALAQTGTSKGSTAGGASAQAPVGHRQPRAADLPNEKNAASSNDPVSKEDAALDKKIKSICRGC